MVFSLQKHPLDEVLAQRFRIHSGFHAGQQEIIEQLVRGKRVLAIQRTGWGKSLCYQLASCYYPFLTLVFSPLKALMRDQCQRCNNIYQIPAGIVSSAALPEENARTLERAVNGELKILYIAPERLDNRGWQESVRQMRISMVVIDEAHCISTWGHDFRPHYRRIFRLLQILPENLPVLALTATANARVEEDILQQIGQRSLVIRGSMQRPNLRTGVVNLQGDQEKLSYLAANIATWQGSGIIYTSTKHSAEMTATFLQQLGIDAEYYHAGRDEVVRQEIEQGLMNNRYKVVCSTNALGMGIDKPDLRFLIHYHIPSSPIQYYQEIGRAGRDGKPAQCLLFYDPEDLIIQQYFIQGAKPSGQAYERVLFLIRNEVQGLKLTDLLRATGFSKGALQNILLDLEDQGLIKKISDARYISEHSGKIDFSFYEGVRLQKQQELLDMQNYAQARNCYMGYLTNYLGDPSGYLCETCANCQPEHFVAVQSSRVINENVVDFLERIFLPRIEKHGSIKKPEHEAGWSLSYHGNTRIGQLVRASKYENAGPFAEELVLKAVEVVREHYPLAMIDGIVSVPPTVSGMLVEDFARRVALQLELPYLSVLEKQRVTQEQKVSTNFVQKKENVKGAFVSLKTWPEAGPVLLLIDDICDSGYMLREVGATLMQAGAHAVYPLTITRTLHSDDQ